MPAYIVQWVALAADTYVTGTCDGVFVNTGLDAVTITCQFNSHGVALSNLSGDNTTTACAQFWKRVTGIR